MAINSFPSKKNLIDNVKQIPGVVNQVLDQYIVRPTGSPNVEGISGFVFDVIGDEAISLESDITDHFLETNTAIQDHIALRPERISLTGYVGELHDLLPNTLLGVLTKVQTVGSVGGLLPEFSTQAAQVYTKVTDVISKAGEVINQAKNIYDIVFNRGTFSTKQQRAYVFFHALWQNRVLCEIETPWGVFTSMAIDSLRVKQDDNTNIVSDFHISFKKINKVRTIQFTAIPSPGKASNVLADPINVGQTAGSPVSNAVLTRVFEEEDFE